jgi:hypothetical protein
MIVLLVADGSIAWAKRQKNVGASGRRGYEVKT